VAERPNWFSENYFESPERSKKGSIPLPCRPGNPERGCLFTRKLVVTRKLAYQQDAAVAIKIRLLTIDKETTVAASFDLPIRDLRGLY
jgi:hypothetical protein